MAAETYLAPVLAAPLYVWRVQPARHLPTWARGEGAFLHGGRWNSPGQRVIYTSLDSSLALLEVAVHLGFDTLDAVPHQLLRIHIHQPERIHRVPHADIPQSSWLTPQTPQRAQQQWADALLNQHGLLALPSSVNPHGWNLLLHADLAQDAYTLHAQLPLTLDQRLKPTNKPALKQAPTKTAPTKTAPAKPPRA